MHGDGDPGRFNRFVTAYNAGDVATLDTLFAPGPAFRWYSSNPPGARLHAAACPLTPPAFVVISLGGARRR